MHYCTIEDSARASSLEGDVAVSLDTASSFQPLESGFGLWGTRTPGLLVT